MEKRKEKDAEQRNLPLRDPPNDEIAERAVLGGMIAEPKLIGKALLEGLEEEDFYYPLHRLLFSLLKELYEQKGEDWDDISFFALTHKKGIDFPRPAFIGILEDGTTGLLWEEALLRIRELSILRNCENAAINILKAEDVEDIYRAKEALEKLLEKGRRQEKSLRAMVSEEIERIKRARESSELLRGVGSGYPDLDSKLLGFEGGQLVVVGARPGMGKSSFMLSLALNMSKFYRVGIFSLEMSASQLIQRALSIMSGVPLQNIRSGFITDEDWERIVSAGLELVKLNLEIDDNPLQSAVNIKAKAKWAGHQVVFVDYMQLIRTEKRYSRQEEVAEISMSLKAMAKQLGIPVIALAQLNRGTETRANKRPTLADLRESGQIEQDADVILFLHRPEYYRPSQELIGRAEVIIAKNRQGPTGVVNLRFDRDTTGFYPAADIAIADSSLPPGEEEDIDIDF